MARPTLQFRSLYGAQLAKYADSILVKMTENADLFPEPDPSLSDFEEALNAFNRSLADAAFRDMRQVTIKNQQLDTLKGQIYEMSLYVTKVAKGDPALIMAAGFVPSKPRAPNGAAPKPRSFTVRVIPENPGHVRLRVQRWAPALVNQFEYRKKDGEALWEKVLSSKSTLELTGLERLEEYEFRVAHIGTHPKITYSDVISSHVL